MSLFRGRRGQECWGTVNEKPFKVYGNVGEQVFKRARDS